MIKKHDKTADPDKEAADIYSLFGKDISKAKEILGQQLNVLQSRAQVLMSLASVVLTITGFSGSRIAGTNLFSKICVVTGLAIVLLSAIWIWMKVLYIRWLTGELGPDPIEMLSEIIKRRNKKTRAYMIGGLILCIGLVIYSIAFMNMLLCNAQ